MGPHPPLNTGWLSKEYAWEAPNLWKVMINKTLQNRPRFTCVKLFRSLKLYTEEVVWGMDSGFAFKSKLIHTLLFIPFASPCVFCQSFGSMMWKCSTLQKPKFWRASNGFYNNDRFRVPSQVPWMTLAKPMSVNLTRPWSVNNKFSGFKSRKTILTAD